MFNFDIFCSFLVRCFAVVDSFQCLKSDERNKATISVNFERVKIEIDSEKFEKKIEP